MEESSEWENLVNQIKDKEHIPRAPDWPENQGATKLATLAVDDDATFEEVDWTLSQIYGNENVIPANKIKRGVTGVSVAFKVLHTWLQEGHDETGKAYSWYHKLVDAADRRINGAILDQQALDDEVSSALSESDIEVAAPLPSMSNKRAAAVPVATGTASKRSRTQTAPSAAASTSAATNGRARAATRTGKAAGRSVSAGKGAKGGKGASKAAPRGKGKGKASTARSSPRSKKAAAAQAPRVSGSPAWGEDQPDDETDEDDDILVESSLLGPRSPVTPASVEDAIRVSNASDGDIGIGYLVMGRCPGWSIQWPALIHDKDELHPPPEKIGYYKEANNDSVLIRFLPFEEWCYNDMHELRPVTAAQLKAIRRDPKQLPKLKDDKIIFRRSVDIALKQAELDDWFETQGAICPKCNQCSQESADQLMQCVECNEYYHFRCGGLQIGTDDENKENWRCLQCS